MLQRIVLALAVILPSAPLLINPPRVTAAPENDFHFSIVGDRAGAPEPQIYGRVLREVALLHPAFAITVGDAIPGGQDETLDAEWAAFRKIWARYPFLKVYHVPGNHDIWSDRSRQRYVLETGYPTHYSFLHQNALIVVAETGRGDELPAGELDFIEEQLKANPGAEPKMIFFHKQFWIDKFLSGDSSFRLHQLARKYGVQAVVSGHGHRFYTMVRDGVRYLEVGSSGGSMRGKLERGEGFSQGCFYHHVWGNVKGNQVQFVVKEIDGLFGHGRMFDAADWDENGPRFPADDPAIAKRPET